MRNLAIIPARSGSKRLPGKNLKLFLDKPLIDWTIKAARESYLVTKIILSSDSNEILDRGVKYGVDFLHHRSPEAARDSASMEQVIENLVESYSKDFFLEFDFITLLQPTSPLRSVADLNAAVEIMIATPLAQTLLSYTNIPRNVCLDKYMVRNEENFLKYVNHDLIAQDMMQKDFVLRNGPAICVSRIPQVLTNLINNPIIGYEMPWWKSIDIDTSSDFYTAELIAKGLEH